MNLRVTEKRYVQYVDGGGCMWMNVDGLAKNREFMWMTIHLHPPSSTFMQVHSHQKYSYKELPLMNSAGNPGHLQKTLFWLHLIVKTQPGTYCIPDGKSREPRTIPSTTENDGEFATKYIYETQNTNGHVPFRDCVRGGLQSRGDVPTTR